MKWFYRYTPGQDWVSKSAGPLGLHDIYLGEGDIADLLRSANFSEQNIERLIMASYVKYMSLPYNHKLVAGVNIRCMFEGSKKLVDCVVVKKDEEGMCFVTRSDEYGNGDELLVTQDEIKYIEKEAAMGNNRRDSTKGGISPELSANGYVVVSDTEVSKDVFQDHMNDVAKVLATAEATPPAKTVITAELVISKYIETRDQIDAEKKLYEEKVAALKAVQVKREQWLTAQLDAQKLSSFKKNGVGTAFFKNRSSATIADQVVFTAWVVADWENRNHFMEKRVSKTAVDASVEEGNTIPPGTNYTTTRVIQINRG